MLHIDWNDRTTWFRAHPEKPLSHYMLFHTFDVKMEIRSDGIRMCMYVLRISKYTSYHRVVVEPFSTRSSYVT